MKFKEYKIFLLFLLVVLCAYMVRDLIYQREAATIEAEYKRAFGKEIQFVPFLVEGSMMYSYAEDVGCGDGIGKFDTSLVGMENLSVHKQFTSGLEYFLGYGYKLKNMIFPSSPSVHAPTDYENNPDFTNWIRIQLRVWISLISGFIFLWLTALRIPWKIAFFGGILHAVSTAAVARYTAQDIVRGNFTLPLIVATFLSATWFLRTPSIKKLTLTGIVAFSALATWDMTQITFSIWCIAEIVRVMAGGKANKKRRHLWFTLSASAIFAAFLIPYHREHNLILSPLVLILLPLVITLHHIAAGKSLKIRFANLAVASLAFLGIWFLIMKTDPSAGNYSHFAELMKAKIRFLNVKPSNPDLLSFEARSVWVPAMHSADKGITKAMFPLMLSLTGLILILSISIKTIQKSFFRIMGIANFPLFMGIFYAVSFFFLVRYHVFAVIFLAVLLPLLLHVWLKNAEYMTLHCTIKTLLITLVYFTLHNVYYEGTFTPATIFNAAIYPLFGMLVAALATAFCAGIYRLLQKIKPAPVFYGKTLIITMTVFLLIFEVDGLLKKRKYEEYFFPQTTALIKWIRNENVEAPIMADFELSPLLKAYCHSKIVLQPKFELGKTRINYEKFMNIMFHEDENALAEFCTENRAEYFIFDKGYPHSMNLYSPRYMAAAHRLKEKSPAYMMNLIQNRNRLRNFYEIRPPQNLQLISDRYILFKVISEKDKKQAEIWAEDAEIMMRNGNLNMAAKLAKSAIFADPNCPQADIMYRKLFRKTPKIRLRGY